MIYRLGNACCSCPGHVPLSAGDHAYVGALRGPGRVVAEVPCVALRHFLGALGPPRGRQRRCALAPRSSRQAGGRERDGITLPSRRASPLAVRLQTCLRVRDAGTGAADGLSQAGSLTSSAAAAAATAAPPSSKAASSAGGGGAGSSATSASPFAEAASAAAAAPAAAAGPADPLLVSRFPRLYVVLVSLHGLVRGERMELGRDPDTGGQVRRAGAIRRSAERCAAGAATASVLPLAWTTAAVALWRVRRSSTWWSWPRRWRSSPA